MNYFPTDRKKIKLIIFLIGALAIISSVLYYQLIYVPENEKNAYLLEMIVAKDGYSRGEQIKFSIVNKGKKLVWYIAPPARCKSYFQWDVTSKKGDSWIPARKYPGCKISKEDGDFIEIRTLKPNENIEGMWDQKLVGENNESLYAKSGKYKFEFYYSKELINKNEIESGSGVGIKTSDSPEFDISGDIYDDVAKKEIGKENDIERKSDLEKIKKEIELYYTENKLAYFETSGFRKLSEDSFEINKILSGRIDKETIFDPKHPEYYYGYMSNGSKFELSARLENLEDESCEMVGESLCIYRIDSLGNISQRKHGNADVITVGGAADLIMEKLQAIDMGDDVIMITSDLVGNEEEAVISETRPPENMKIKKAIETVPEDLAQNNLVLSGNSSSNSIIAELNKKSVIVDIADWIEVEKNNIVAVLKYAKNPWNQEKSVLVFETGYSMNDVARIKGILKVEKKEEFYHITFDEQSGNKFAVVPSFEKDGAIPQNLLEYDGKNAEIFGYKRVRHSDEFPIENSIGVIEINTID